MVQINLDRILALKKELARKGLNYESFARMADVKPETVRKYVHVWIGSNIPVGKDGIPEKTPKGVKYIKIVNTLREIGIDPVELQKNY